MCNCHKISPQLADLIAASDTAGAALERYNAAFLRPVQEAVESQEAAIPHFSVVIDRTRWSTEDEGMIRAARRFVTWDPGRRMVGTVKFRDLIAAYLRRRRAVEQLRKKARLHPIGAESDALCDRWVRAQYAVGDFPCRTAVDLHAKLKFMVANEVDGDLQSLLPEVASIAEREGCRHG